MTGSDKIAAMPRRYRDGVICLFLGIFLASVFLACYSISEVADEDLANGTIVTVLAETSQWLDGYGIVWTFLALAVAVVLYWTWLHWKNREEKLQWRLIILSLVFGAANVAGLCMYNMDALPVSVGKAWMVMAVLFTVGWAIAFYVAAYWFLWLLEHKLCVLSSDREKEQWDGSVSESEARSAKNGAGARGGWKRLAAVLDCHIGLAAFFVILLCWLPWIILYYPASMDNDVYWMLASFLGDIPKTNHHPWFASCVLGVFYKLGVRLGSENLGIFLFVLVRDILIAAIYAGCVRLLKKSGVRRAVCVIALLFYAVTPVWGAYAKHAFKDTFSAALFCLYIVSMIVLIRKVRRAQASTLDFLGYGIIALLTSLFRNNCIYSVFPITLLLLVWLLKKRERWYRLLLVFVCLCMYFVYNQYIFNVAGVSKGDLSESMSIMLQQTARTIKYRGDEISEEERETINGYLIYDELAEVYDPILSDPIKSRLQSDQEDGATVNYLTTWAKMFFEYPVTYLEAFVGQSYGYYAFTPKHEYWEGNWNANMTIFDWIGSNGWDYGYNFYYAGDWESARQVLDKWADVWQEIPVLNLTNTIAFYTWSIVLIGYYIRKKKRFGDLLPILALLVMVLTCMASPVNDCFRYYAPVAASAPALLALLDKRENDEIKT